MERLIVLADEPNGEGVLIDDDRHLVSQILVPSRYDISHLADHTTVVAKPTDVYTAQVNLISVQHYWMWPVKGDTLTFPATAANHKAN